MVAGICTVGFILLVVVSALAGFFLDTDVAVLLEEFSRPVTLSIIRFTLLQAALSTVLSLAVAVPLSIALARRQQFFGRRLIIMLSSISFIIPVMVAVLGIVAVHGLSLIHI